MKRNPQGALAHGTSRLFQHKGKMKRNAQGVLAQGTSRLFHCLLPLPAFNTKAIIWAGKTRGLEVWTHNLSSLMALSLTTLWCRAKNTVLTVILRKEEQQISTQLLRIVILQWYCIQKFSNSCQLIPILPTSLISSLINHLLSFSTDDYLKRGGCNGYLEWLISDLRVSHRGKEETPGTV